MSTNIYTNLALEELRIHNRIKKIKIDNFILNIPTEFKNNNIH